MAKEKKRASRNEESGTCGVQNQAEGTALKDKGEVFGVSVRAWTLTILISFGVALCLFVVAPFVIAMVMPLFQNKNADHLVDLIDGVALIVGITGTIASIASIVMTLVDKRRYNQEKSQMQELSRSVEMLHNEVEMVAQTVNKTLLQNRQMGDAMFKGNLIPFNPNTVDICSNFDGTSNPWVKPQEAHEIPLSAKSAGDEEPTTCAQTTKDE